MHFTSLIATGLIANVALVAAISPNRLFRRQQQFGEFGSFGPGTGGCTQDLDNEKKLSCGQSCFKPNIGQACCPDGVVCLNNQVCGSTDSKSFQCCDKGNAGCIGVGTGNNNNAASSVSSIETTSTSTVTATVSATSPPQGTAVGGAFSPGTCAFGQTSLPPITRTAIVLSSQVATVTQCEVTVTSTATVCTTTTICPVNDPHGVTANPLAASAEPTC